jgi:hypothetical protein
MEVRHHPHHAQQEHDLVAGVVATVPKGDHARQIETL